MFRKMLFIVCTRGLHGDLHHDVQGFDLVCILYDFSKVKSDLNIFKYMLFQKKIE
jgi:hypothetical protein